MFDLNSDFFGRSLLFGMKVCLSQTDRHLDPSIKV